MTPPPVFDHKLALYHGSLHHLTQVGVRMPPALTTSNQHGRCISPLDGVVTHLSSLPPPPPSGMLGGSIPPHPRSRWPPARPGEEGGASGLEMPSAASSRSRAGGEKARARMAKGGRGSPKLPPAEALLHIARPPISLALQPAARGGPPRHRGLGFPSSPRRTQERESRGKRLERKARQGAMRLPDVPTWPRREKEPPPGAAAASSRSPPPAGRSPLPTCARHPLAHHRTALAAWIAPRPRAPLSFSGQPGRGSSSGWGCAAPLARSSARPGGLPARRRRRSPCAALPGRARRSLPA